jgi:hypothetical protein
MTYCVLPNLESDKPRDKRGVSLAWALLAVALLMSWQFCTVHYNWHGNWTALFCTGEKLRVPPLLDPGTYRFANSTGYDGQMYRYVAHDPLGRLGFSEYIDDRVLRYRRILIPALAFALAGGRQESIDKSYIAVIAVFVLAGSYWLSRWAASQKLHPAWGLTFLLTPATVVSMDRMTVDVGIAAFTVGLAYYATIRSTARLYCVLLLACLARETGALLLAATWTYELWSGRFARALGYATACIPMLIWYRFVSTHFQVAGTGFELPRWLEPKFRWGIVGRMLDPLRYPLPAALEALTRSLDVIALLGIIGAIAASILLLFLCSPDPLRMTGALFAILAVVITRPHYWDECFSYSRIFTPLLIATALSALNGKAGTRPWWWMLAPAVLVDLRIGLQLGPQALGVLQGIAGR